MTMGGRIKLLREGKGFTQAELARRIGIKQPSVFAIEKGDTRTLRADTLMRLAAALDANPYYIWTGHGSPVAPIDPNVDEAQAADIYRRMTPANRGAWMEIGGALLRAQPAVAPSKADPFPVAPKPKKSRP